LQETPRENLLVLVPRDHLGWLQGRELLPPLRPGDAMTTIVYRDGVMAADTRMIQRTAIIGNITKIVRRNDGALCGGAGDAAWVVAFHDWFLAGEQGDPPAVPDSCKGLVAVKRRPVELFEQSGAFKFKAPYVAIGSGMEFALGAMHMGASAPAAVRTAMKFDPGTGGKLMVLTHDKA
jgi:ATP-dependent HslUV protease subunit HslV